jgi:hypothetical protein
MRNWLKIKVMTWRLRRWYRKQYLGNAHKVEVLGDEA